VASVNSPSATPTVGPPDGYAALVGPAATGVWSGHDGDIAIYMAGWYFIAPYEGLIAYSRDSDLVYKYDGANWVDIVPAPAPTPPGGLDTQVQYNNGGSFGGDSTFTFNDTTKVLTVSGLDVNGTTNLNGEVHFQSSTTTKAHWSAGAETFVFGSGAGIYWSNAASSLAGSVDARLRRKTTKTLSIDDGAAGAVTLEVIGTVSAGDGTNQAQVTVSPINTGTNRAFIGTTSTGTSSAFYFVSANTYRGGFQAGGGFSLGSTFFNKDPGANNMTLEGKLAIGKASPIANLDLVGALVVSSVTNVAGSLTSGQGYFMGANPRVNLFAPSVTNAATTTVGQKVSLYLDSGSNVWLDDAGGNRMLRIDSTKHCYFYGDLSYNTGTWAIGADGHGDLARLHVDVYAAYDNRGLRLENGGGSTSSTAAYPIYTSPIFAAGSQGFVELHLFGFDSVGILAYQLKINIAVLRDGTTAWGITNTLENLGNLSAVWAFFDNTDGSFRIEVTPPTADPMRWAWSIRSFYDYDGSVLSAGGGGS
jgi:hypothetical protein